MLAKLCHPQAGINLNKQKMLVGVVLTLCRIQDDLACHTHVVESFLDELLTVVGLIFVSSGGIVSLWSGRLWVQRNGGLHRVDHYGRLVILLLLTWVLRFSFSSL